MPRLEKGFTEPTRNPVTRSKRDPQYDTKNGYFIWSTANLHLIERLLNNSETPGITGEGQTLEGLGCRGELIWWADLKDYSECGRGYRRRVGGTGDLATLEEPPGVVVDQARLLGSPPPLDRLHPVRLRSPALLLSDLHQRHQGLRRDLKL